MTNYKVEISHKTVLYTIGVLVGLYVLFLIRDILFGVFIAVMIMSGLNPFVTWMEKHRMPRNLAIMLVYIVLLSMIGLIFMAIIPAIVDQTTNIAHYLPWDEINKYIQQFDVANSDWQLITSQLGSIPKALGVVTSTFSSILTIITLLVMTFYLLQSRKTLSEKIEWLFEAKNSKELARDFVDKVEIQIGRWVRGEMSLLLIIGLMTFVGLKLLGIPYAVPLAVVAGLLEILPNIGPIISAIPALIIAYASTGSWPLVGAVAILYTIVQQIENNLIVPQVMKSVVGVDPIFTIILLLVGFRLGGVAGAALAIPIYLVLRVVLVEFYKAKKVGE